jgi:hypothetical protein
MKAEKRGDRRKHTRKKMTPVMALTGVSAGNGYRPSKKCVRGQASFMENLRMFCRAQRPSKDLSCEAVHQIYNFY